RTRATRESSATARSIWRRRSPTLEPSPRYAVLGAASVLFFPLRPRPLRLGFLVLVELVVVVTVVFFRGRHLFPELVGVLLGDRLHDHGPARGPRRGRRGLVGPGVLLVGAALGTDRFRLAEVVKLRAAVVTLVFLSEIRHLPPGGGT